MLLSLLVTSSQSAALGAARRKIFSEEGGAIGRGKDKDWVLPDPSHHISNTHAIIDFQQDAYYIVDTSTNGVFINDNRGPVGKNNRVKLNKGDYIYIGDYEIAVSLEEEEPISSDTPATGASLSDDYKGGIPDGMDPLDLFGPGVESADEEQIEEGADDHLKDHSPALDEFFKPPDVSQEKMIPDDWNITGFSSSHEKAASKATAGGESSSSGLDDSKKSDEPIGHIPEDWALTGFALGKSKKESIARGRDIEKMAENKRPVPPAPLKEEKQRDHNLAPGLPPKAQDRPREKVADPQHVRVSQRDDVELLLHGIGLDSARIPPEIANELPEIIGLLFREFVKGLMEVLMARSDLKSAFRVDQTMIRPAENNPLKFSVGVDAALENMLLKKGSGFLPPLDAVKEGFKDIKAHQVAMMAGMQGALKGVLERFNPEELEERFTVGPKGSKLFSVYNKSRFWDRYKELYEEIVGEAMDNFQRLLGEKFARAYEEQMNKVDASGRKPMKKG